MDRGSQLDEEDDEEEEEDEEEKEEDEEDQATDIKSNNPHLAGGEKTPSKHQRTIWPCHSLASRQTQIHSTTGTPGSDVLTVPKPSRTLDHCPCLRIEHQGEI